MILTGALIGAVFILLRKGQHVKHLPKIGWVYCLFSPSFPYMGKVGFSETPDIRRSDIRASMSREYGRDIRLWTVCMVPVFWARDFETYIHRSKLWMSVSKMKGSGRTEWGWCMNIIASITTLIVCYVFGYDNPSQKALIVALIPFPIDYCLYLLLFFAVQVSVVIGLVYVFIV